MDAFEEIQNNIAGRKVNILKGFVEVNDAIEKARNVGDVHPNGKWVWKQLPSGKFDWRTIPGGGGQASAPTQNAQPKKEDATPAKKEAPHKAGEFDIEKFNKQKDKEAASYKSWIDLKNRFDDKGSLWSPQKQRETKDNLHYKEQTHKKNFGVNVWESEHAHLNKMTPNKTEEKPETKGDDKETTPPKGDLKWLRSDLFRARKEIPLLERKVNESRNAYQSEYANQNNSGSVSRNYSYADGTLKPKIKEAEDKLKSAQSRISELAKHVKLLSDYQKKSLAEQKARISGQGNQ